MSIAHHHAEWLRLIEVSGPFLSVPVLMEAFPQGLEVHDSEHQRLLRRAFDAWEDDRANPATHNAWIRFVLGKTLDYPPEMLVEGQAIPQTLQVEVPEHGELLRPDLALVERGGRARMLIKTYPAGVDLTKPVAGLPWHASPDTRMTELLHGTGVRLGLVTNGERWMLVDAPKDGTTGFASWYATLWLEEPLTIRAFRTLLSAERFFGVAEPDTPEGLLARSATKQQEVTEQLGFQVRRAVEVLIQTIDKADENSGRELLRGVREAELYEAALTVMMRLVILFCAEERGLLLLGDELYDEHYAVSTIWDKLQAVKSDYGEEVLERRHDAWCRLLTTFRAVHGGVRHDLLKLPSYGGRLFDPDRFPFLEGRRPGTTWRQDEAHPLPVDNRTVLHLLEALQWLQTKGPGGSAEARRLSFRALDIEQIGHVYEGLLDHTAKRAIETYLGLIGPEGDEPEVPLSELERLWEKGEAHLIEFLNTVTGRTEPRLREALAVELDAHEVGHFHTACRSDEAIWKRVRPFAGLVRQDSFGYPAVIPRGSFFVTEGTDRRSSGTQYTPRSLTEPIVQHALEPLVYVGPAEGKPRDEWKLRSAAELLDLKVCDMACGSGAFLVQACRYLAQRLQEAWDEEEKRTPGLPRRAPEGLPSEGHPGEAILGGEEDREMTALRLIAGQCFYGVDKNPLAVEMAKLSLWLLTMAKDRPFTFLDHAIRPGDSLVGVDLDQLRTFSLDRKGTEVGLFGNIMAKKLDALRLLREQLAHLPNDDARDIERKQRMFENVRDQTKRLTYAADMLLAASWRPAKAAERARRLKETLFHVDYRFKDVAAEELEAEGRKRLDEEGCPIPADKDPSRTTRPFHWPLEFPEVFLRKSRPGFDALVGNPPFKGGQHLTGLFGKEYREHLVSQIAEEKRGSADLCAYFFLRARSLLREGGTLGLVAINTLKEGDTREVGLDQLVEGGCPIYTNAERVLPAREEYTRCVYRLKLSHLVGRTIPPGFERKHSLEW